MSVDFRIMGVKQRREKFILNMLNSLSMDETIVSYDEDGLPKNAMRNARKTWTKPTKHSHICVMQDDLELCDNFKEIVEECAKQFPNCVFSFYNSRLRWEDKAKDTPYLKVNGCGMYGQIIMMPTSFVEPLFFWCDKVYGRDYPHDDTVIGFFCSVHNIPVMTTIPCIVQHLGCSNSVLGYNNKNKVSKVYQKDVGLEVFKTNKFGITKYIPNTEIPPKGGYKTGRLVKLSEV